MTFQDRSPETRSRRDEPNASTQGTRGPKRVPIYSELEPDSEPRWVRPTVERLIAWLPESYCRGLGALVLTNSALSSKRKGRRMRRNRRGITLGIYHPAWSGNPAWIELIVDVIVTQLPPAPLHRLRVVQDLVMGEVLFHEVGHHLDYTVGSVGRTGEHGAEAWEARISRQYFRGRYWYVKPLAPVFRVVSRVIRALEKRSQTKSSS